MMNILHVVWSLEVAGAEKLAFDMARSLPRDKFRALVCSINQDGILGDMLRKDGYPVFHRHKQPGFDWSMVRWLRKIIREERVDVIHAHQYSPAVYAAFASLGLGKPRIVYTEHGRNYPEVLRWKRRLVNPLFAGMIDSIVSISESTRQAMIEYDKLPANRIQVIHNGVDKKKVRGTTSISEKKRELEIPEGFSVIGTAARFDEVKNLPMMLQAFQQVATLRPDTLLLIAGTGPLEEPLKRMAKELGISEKTRFVGLRHDLPDLFGIFSAFLLTSFTEGISVTLLEAMANGIPAVVTDVGGNPEVVVDGVTGYLVPLGDHEYMAGKIVQLLGDPAASAAMGVNCTKRIDAYFTFSRMMAYYLDLYQSGSMER